MSLFGGRRDDSEETADDAAGAAAVAPAREPRREQRTIGDPLSPEGGSVANIGKSIVFKGDLSGDEDLQIDGQVEGGIQLANHQLTIGETGRVQAQLFAKSVIVIGHVTGNITATERVDIRVSGVVEGDIHAPRLIVADGAVLNGTVEMTRNEPGVPETSR